MGSTNFDPLAYTGRVIGTTKKIGSNQYNSDDFTIDKRGVVSLNGVAGKVIASGQGTLVLGTFTSNLSSIEATDIVLLSRHGVNASSALGLLDYSISAGTSFTVTALDPTDASTETDDVSDVDYVIVRPS